MMIDSFDVWWWPFAYILLAGWIATDMWRWLGVLLGNRIDETAELLVFVRAVATALVAAVIAQLILFPSGALSETPVALRVAAVLIGFVSYIVSGCRIYVGIALAMGVLVLGF